MFNCGGLLPLLFLPPPPSKVGAALGPVPKPWATAPALSAVLSCRLFPCSADSWHPRSSVKLTPFLHVQPNVLKVGLQLSSQLPALQENQAAPSLSLLPPAHVSSAEAPVTPCSCLYQPGPDLICGTGEGSSSRKEQHNLLFSLALVWLLPGISYYRYLLREGREGMGWRHVLCSLFTATRCAVVNHTLLSCFPSKDTARCFTPVFREEGMWGEGKTSETFAAALTPDEHTLGMSALGCERSDFLPQNRNKRNSLIAESPPDWRNCLFHCVCHAVI